MRPSTMGQMTKLSSSGLDTDRPWLRITSSSSAGELKLQRKAGPGQGRTGQRGHAGDAPSMPHGHVPARQTWVAAALGRC